MQHKMQHEINKCCKIGNVRLFLTGSSPVIRIFYAVLVFTRIAKKSSIFNAYSNFKLAHKICYFASFGIKKKNYATRNATRI
nr:MAG TPA: hypothetical protein [Caudoviricetes sp.]